MFNGKALFSHTPELNKRNKRRIVSNQPKLVDKYVTEVYEQHVASNLNARAHMLQEKESLTDEDHEELEEISEPINEKFLKTQLDRGAIMGTYDPNYEPLSDIDSKMCQHCGNDKYSHLDFKHKFVKSEPKEMVF